MNDRVNDSRYAAYLFDFDGTLANTDELNFRAARAGLAAFGVDVGLDWLAAEPLSTIGRLRERLGLRSADVPDGPFVDAARAYWLVHADQVRPIDTAVATVREAADQAPVAVVSDNDGEVVRVALAAAGLADIVSAVVAREDVRRLKPAPESYLLAARLVAADPVRCLAYENSDQGVAAATAAGMAVVDVRGRDWL